jgi:DNA-binding NtrC family response regulator
MTSKHKILVVDDERNTRDGLRRALAPIYDVTLAENGERALDLLRDQRFDVALTDLRMPGLDGLSLIREVSALPNAPVCIMLTAYGTVATAVEAMKVGAYDYLTKPINLDGLEMAITRALEARFGGDSGATTASADSFQYMIGRSPAMQAVFDKISQVAPARSTVLLTGESGTGKELAARALHQLSDRADQPFVAVHCAALASNLLQSELFGHEKGAFTNAAEQRIGRFEAADGGTIFLDEIGDIDPAVQVTLLRMLESRSFERVGGTTPVAVDVRVITATNQDLKQMVADGDFREDLYYRLDVINIEVPPLRQRREDIPLLLAHYLQVFNDENGKQVAGFDPAAESMMLSYRWRGNIRELRNCVERMVVLARGATITVHDVPEHIAAAAAEDSAGNADADPLDIEDNERRLIAQALSECDGNRTAAARKLGVSRRTIIRKIEKFGLDL